MPSDWNGWLGITDLVAFGDSYTDENRCEHDCHELENPMTTGTSFQSALCFKTTVPYHLPDLTVVR